MATTSWEIVQDGEPTGPFTSAKGRQFQPGDLVNMPPPLPYGGVWRVVAIEDAAEGFDGKLILEFVAPATPRAEQPTPG